MLLSIIIVNFNTSKLLHDCLVSIDQSDLDSRLKDNMEVIVVDNASSDDSMAMVKRSFPHVKRIENDKNLGFAKANNQGIKKAQGKYVLLLNSDTKIFADTLTKLIKTAEEYPQSAVVGAKLLNQDGSVQQSAGYFPTLPKIFYWMFFIDDIPHTSFFLKPYHVTDRQFYRHTHEVDWVSGACFLVKKEVINKSDLLDENIFMYGEEVEWCYRIRQTGKKVVFTASTALYHFQGASGQGSYSGIVEEFKSLLYFYRKHKPTYQLPILRLLLLFGALLRIGLFGIIEGDSSKRKLYAQAFDVAGR